MQDLTKGNDLCTCKRILLKAGEKIKFQISRDKRRGRAGLGARALSRQLAVVDTPPSSKAFPSQCRGSQNSGVSNEVTMLSEAMTVQVPLHVIRNDSNDLPVTEERTEFKTKYITAHFLNTITMHIIVSRPDIYEKRKDLYNEKFRLEPDRRGYTVCSYSVNTLLDLFKFSFQ